ncbi:MAG: Abi-alpha family protein [Dongiaceae bacterium]
MASLEARTIQHLKTLGYDAPPCPVPLKVLVPLLQSATLEEDDDLQDIWAALLANASTPELGDTISVSFVDMLKCMGPLDVKILSVIYLAKSGSPKDVFVTQDLPAKTEVYNGVDKPRGLPDLATQASIWNLVRLGCLTAESSSSGSRKAIFVALTALGERFVEACTVGAKGGT